MDPGGTAVSGTVSCGVLIWLNQGGLATGTVSRTVDDQGKMNVRSVLTGGRFVFRMHAGCKSVSAQ